MAKLLWSWINSILFGRNSDIDAIKEPDVQHIAIDQSGHLGSLYDECRDTITGKLDMDLKSHIFKINEPITCELHKGLSSECENLLQMVDIDRSLRLSIMLKIIQPIGIASIIDYPRPINQYTRFLYFCHVTRHESCHADLVQKQSRQRLSEFEASVTHIIAEIVWGIHAVIVLQLPPDQQVEIDHVLEQICHNLINTEYHVEMKLREKALFDQIISTTVYSNIPSLTSIIGLYDVWQRILRMKDHPNEHCRLKYMLSPIQSFYPDYPRNSAMNSQTYPHQIGQLEPYLCQQFSEIKVLKARLDNHLPELLQGQLEEPLNNCQRDFLTITELHENDMQYMRDLVLRMRLGNAVVYSIDQLVSPNAQTKTKESMQRLSISLDKLASKIDLINYLQSEGFEYCNVAKLEIEPNFNEQLIKDILLQNDTNKIIFCSHDLLKEQSPQNWKDLYSQMIEKRKENPSLTLIYADFTYSTLQWTNMIILSSKERKIDAYGLNYEVTTSYLEKSETPLSPLESSDEFINILLIGESGVGKSTFINAFANYLKFDSLEQAQAGQPIVIIPVSFVMTVNDNFDEQLIKFGEVDPNENHNNTGQSVTQQCRAYVFQISPGKKLRIIDTPGFGDTQGGNHDEMNMKMIFSFINQLTYINGICLLFKPNDGQLNLFLYSCFTRLFQFFGENIRDHFIFCFTNARSTFFAPGDTRPLLKTLFNSLSVKNIPFEKKNTFCFDSESFRYLVALQRSLIFNAMEKDEFEKSWTRSVRESQRLRDFLCEEMRPYRKNMEWQSIEAAQLQITFMVRPMLEVIRNILRNILLYETNSSIQLKAACVDQPTIICYKCDRTPQMFNEFWIFPDHTHHSPSRVSIKAIYRLN
jgi:GTP-binding protein EngB required for normal cell division